MRQVAALVVIIAAMLGGIGLLFNAPPGMSEEVVMLLGVAFAGSLVIILRGPFGKALAGTASEELKDDREARERLTAQLEELIDELREARQDTMELQERVDFAERLLTQSADQKHLETP